MLAGLAFGAVAVLGDVSVVVEAQPDGGQVLALLPALVAVGGLVSAAGAGDRQRSWMRR